MRIYFRTPTLVCFGHSGLVYYASYILFSLCLFRIGLNVSVLRSPLRSDYLILSSALDLRCGVYYAYGMNEWCNFNRECASGALGSYWAPLFVTSYQSQCDIGEV